ncbi:sensor domain-containing diguanylate cyclase [Pseudoalteromonas rubra]|uniref:sensor domain-containing diguanylate cyclase n=1 Tax=Pseudoalteromonas rubra TaxID=43658 RepID=UPI0006971ABC|nr:sensor domain-containing diguanylate cyclase [Pseudoalteromonas rubra]
MKLKHLLIATFILVTALPLFIGLYSLNSYTGVQYREQVKSNLSAISQIAKLRILAGVERANDNVAQIASRTQLRRSLVLWNDTRDAQYRAQITRIINDAALDRSYLRSIGVFDHQGQFVTATQGFEKLSTLASAQFEDRPIRLEQHNGVVQLSRVAPLLLDGRLAGYVKVDFSTQFLNQLVRDRTGLGQTGEWLIAMQDDNGDALFATPLKYDPKAAFTRTVAFTQGTVPIIQALSGNELVLEQSPDYRGVPVLASTRYIEQLGWGLVAKMDESEVNAMVYANRTVIYAAELGIVLLAVIVGVGLSIYISQPIENLKTYIEKVTHEGELIDPPRVTRGWQEVRELTAHFSYMMHTLRTLNENLQDKIDERTAELTQANALLEKTANQDPLTSLFNRRFFTLRFEQELDRSTRYGCLFALVLLDIDYFKKINDQWGHDMGDEVLKEVARFLLASSRSSDLVARIGGEEFCILIPECEQDKVLVYLERLRCDLTELNFTAKDTLFTISASFGVAFYQPGMKSGQVLLKQADEALYEAKHAGRNRVCMYQGQLPN